MNRKSGIEFFVLLIISIFIVLLSSCDFYLAIYPKGTLEIDNNSSYAIISICTISNDDTKSNNLLFERLEKNKTKSFAIDRNTEKVEIIFENQFQLIRNMALQ